MLIKISHALTDVKQILNDRKKEQEMPIASLPSLSSKIWGVQRGKLYVIGARTGIGKSAFTIQICFDLALQGKKVLFLSLESTIAEVIERIFCNRFSVDNFDLTCGKFDRYQEEWQKFEKELLGLKFLISDSIGRTMNEIQDIVDKMQEKPDILAIDYIQMIKNISKQKNEDIAEFVKFLRNTAVRNNMAVLLVSQINREGEGEMPTLAQLKGSGVLEEHPDVVFLLHAKPDDAGDIKKYYFFVAKNRNGRIGKINISYLGKFYKFIDSVGEPLSESEKSQQIKKIEMSFDGGAYEKFIGEEE